MKTKNKTKTAFFAIVLCLLMIIPLFIIPSSADDAADIEKTVPESEEEKEEKEEKEIDISFYRIKYCGGLVTYFFGRWASAVDEESGRDYITSEVNLPVFLIASLLCAAIAYFLCSINPQIVLSKRMYGVDLRSEGDRSADLTNLKYLFGWKPTILALLLCVLETAIAVFLALLVGGEICACFSGIFCISGHALPAFYNFRGGKGMICALTAVAILEPVAAIVLLIAFLAIVIGTKYVSLGAIMTSLLYPLIMRGVYSIVHADVPASNQGIPVLTSFIIAAIIVVMYRKNIKNLFNGQETKFSFKKGGALNSDEKL